MQKKYKKKNNNRCLRFISRLTVVIILIFTILIGTSGKSSINNFLLAGSLPCYGRIGVAYADDGSDRGQSFVSTVLGVNDVTSTDEKFTTDISEAPTLSDTLSSLDTEKLSDVENLRTKYYTVDSDTAMTPEIFNVDNFCSDDLTIDNSEDGPKVLIIHTHGHEMYADSTDPSQGVFAVGEELQKILEEKYGIETMHLEKFYDQVEDEVTVQGAYERMEPDVLQILAQYPTIQVVIDIHRDGVDANTHLLTDVNGKETAPVMFVNGISEIYDDNGNLVPISDLPNQNLEDNLAFSFQCEVQADAMYPDLCKKIYINAYRYSTNMLPRSILVEVGAQTNTLQEALNAVEPIADVIASVLLGN